MRGGVGDNGNNDEGCQPVTWLQASVEDRLLQVGLEGDNAGVGGGIAVHHCLPIVYLSAGGHEHPARYALRRSAGRGTDAIKASCSASASFTSHRSC
eukprot:scaffold118386_cov35-Phaeocystis_antarctica.AAC.3